MRSWIIGLTAWIYIAGGFVGALYLAFYRSDAVMASLMVTP